MALARQFSVLQACTHPKIHRVKQRLLHHSGVDIHFLIMLAVRFDIDHDGWESAGYGRRRQDDLADQFERLGMSAGRNGAEIPNNRTLLIEAGRPDHQQAAVPVRGGDVRKHPLIHVTRNETVKRPGVGERLPEYDAVEAVQGAKCPNLLLAFYGRVTLAQALDVRPAEEREWRDHPASADPGHQLERRHGAAVEPAAQEPGPEGAVTTAAGDREKMCR